MTEIAEPSRATLAVEALIERLSRFETTLGTAADLATLHNVTSRSERLMIRMEEMRVRLEALLHAHATVVVSPGKSVTSLEPSAAAAATVPQHAATTKPNAAVKAIRNRFRTETTKTAAAPPAVVHVKFVFDKSNLLGPSVDLYWLSGNVHGNLAHTATKNACAVAGDAACTSSRRCTMTVDCVDAPLVQPIARTPSSRTSSLPPALRSLC